MRKKGVAHQPSVMDRLECRPSATPCAHTVREMGRELLSDGCDLQVGVDGEWRTTASNFQGTAASACTYQNRHVMSAWASARDSISVKSSSATLRTDISESWLSTSEWLQTLEGLKPTASFDWKAQGVIHYTVQCTVHASASFQKGF